jgi:hypothetical protein
MASKFASSANADDGNYLSFSRRSNLWLLIFRKQKWRRLVSAPISHIPGVAKTRGPRRTCHVQLEAVMVPLTRGQVHQEVK